MNSRLTKNLGDIFKLLPAAVRAIAEEDPEIQQLLACPDLLGAEIINLRERLRTADGIIQKLLPTVKPSQRSSEVYLRACSYLQDTQTSV